MQKEVMFSSVTDEWATPQDFFDKYNAVYHFNLEPACTHANAKCEQHYTRAEDGLSKSWGGVEYGSTLRMAERSGSGYGKPMKKA